jgi:hypothetical protein
MTTIVTQGGPGTWTITDDTSAAIAAQTLVLQAGFDALILQIGSPEVPETMLAIMSGTQGTLSIMSAKLQQIDDNLKKVNIQLTTLNGKLEQNKTGLAEISTHMSQQATIQKMTYLDNAKHIEFQQQTTNNSLKDAGKPPTVVTPAAFVAKVENNLKDLTTINAQTSIVSTITDYSTSAVTTAYTKALDWAAKTEIGQWITTTYADLKLKVTALFSTEIIKETADGVKQAANDIKSGNAPTLGPK